MADNNITNENKRHAVIMSTKVKHSNLKIGRFLKSPDLSFVKLKKLKAYGLETNLWSLSSCDLIPLEYYVCGIAGREINKYPITPNPL